MVATATLIIFSVFVWGYFTLAEGLQSNDAYHLSKCFDGTGITTVCDIGMRDAVIVRILRNDSTTVPSTNYVYSGTTITITES